MTAHRPPSPLHADSQGEHAAVVSQTPTSEKMEKDGNVKVVENEGAASSKSKEASKDGLKNYLVSNLC